MNPIPKSHTREKKLRIVYANVRGIKGKITSIKTVIDDLQPDIMGIIETHLNDQQKIKIQGYTYLPTTRKDKKGGGLAYLIKNKLTKDIDVTDGQGDGNDITEQEWIRINFDDAPPYHIGLYYGKQEKEPIHNINHDLSSMEDKITAAKRNNQEVMLIGDFNSKIQIPIYQPQPSRNGRILEDFIKNNELIVINTSQKCKGVWTRVDTNDNTKKSIIDYCLVTPKLMESVDQMIIDDDELYKIMGRKPTDHNTFIIDIKVPLATHTKNETTYHWKINENTQWEEYETQLANTLSKKIQGKRCIKTKYKNLIHTINKAGQIAIGKRKTQTTHKRPYRNKPTREATREKKKLRKEYQQAIRTQINVKQAKDNYIQAQKKLRKTIDEMQTQQAETTIKKIIEDGGVHSKMFWALKRKDRQTNAEDMYSLMDKDGNYIIGEIEVKKYVANYYKDLYAKNTDPYFDREWTTQVQTNIEELELNNDYEHLPINTPITRKEVQKTIKNLPNNKASGPDEIPYELYKYGGEKLTDTIYDIFTQIFEEETIPQDWLSTTMVSLPKPTKSPHLSENKRGLTLNNSIEKIFQRILLNRLSEVIPFTEAQAGARKGRSTTDQIFTLKSVLYHRKSQGKTTYLAFIDIEKAYDKVWKAGVLLNLWRKGIRGKLWRILKKLNQGLTTKVRTRYGYTEEIEIEESLRQGGVLSGPEFASYIDDLEKELQQAGLGVEYIEILIASLLLMDDIILIADSPQMLQRMLDIITNFAKKWHFYFNMSKCKLMIIGNDNHQYQWTLNSQLMQLCRIYVYLGEVIANDLKMTDHITKLKQKAFAIYNTISAVAQDHILARIQMSTLLHMYQRCLLPAILYNSETWLLTEAEFKEIEQIQLIMMRKIIKAPNSTPITALYLELGIWPIQFQIKQRQLMYTWKAANSKTITHNILRNNEATNSKWFQYINKTATDIGLETNISKLQQLKKKEWKKAIGEAINATLKKRFKEDVLKKSKLTRLLYRIEKKQVPGYIKDLPRDLAATIFRIRSRTTNVKDNQSYGAPICRYCTNGLESDSHIFQYCDKFKELRNKFQITGIHEDVFTDTGNTCVLRKHAQFAIQAGIVPGCMDPDDQ